jgi:hypothetical protein
MPENAIRFGIRAVSGHRAATWKCWTGGIDGSEVYLACRELNGELKASFHESGQWHIAYSPKFFGERFEEATRPATRFVDKWPRPIEIAPGFTLAFQILVPWSSATVPDSRGEADIVWVSPAPHGQAVEISVVITSPACRVSDWPGKRSMQTELIGSISLPNGQTVWVIYRRIDMVLPELPAGALRYFKGADKTRLRTAGLRALVWGDRPDGARVIWDLPVKSDTNAPSPLPSPCVQEGG